MTTGLGFVSFCVFFLNSADFACIMVGFCVVVFGVFCVFLHLL